MSKKNRGPELDPWTETLMDLKEKNPQPPAGLVEITTRQVILEREVARRFRQRGLLTNQQLQVFEEGVKAALSVTLTHRGASPMTLEDLMVEAASPYRQIIAELRSDFYGKHKRT